MGIAPAVMKGVVSLVSKEVVKRERENGPQLPSTHETKMGENVGPQLPGFRQGWAGVFIRRVQDKGRQCTLRGERGRR